jgi:hypothetical protein
MLSFSFYGESIIYLDVATIVDDTILWSGILGLGSSYLLGITVYSYLTKSEKSFTLRSSNPVMSPQDVDY